MKTKMTHASWLVRCPAAVLLAILSLLLAACRPSDQAAAGVGQPYGFYLADSFIAAGFVPTDPRTLDDVPGGRTLEPGMVSADGTTGVIVEYLAARASLDPKDSLLVVNDLSSGIERARFHPPVTGLVTSLSADGGRLLLQPFPLPPTYPPPVDWYVLDTADGAVMAHIYNEDNACFRQYAQLSPDGRRVYCLVDPALHEISGPQPVRVVAYEVGGRGRPAAPVRPAGEVALETRIGQRPTTDGVGWELLEPALSLSPDGRTLVVVHADADAMTLIDAATLAVALTIDLEPDASLWQRLRLTARLARAKGEMTGVIRHAVFSADGQQLYVFSQELRPGGEPVPAERGLWQVDLARGRIAARALGNYQIQWVMPAPDGSVYAFGTTDERLHPYEIRESSPSMLWRLDGRTLVVLAERAFVGYRGGRLVVD